MDTQSIFLALIIVLVVLLAIALNLFLRYRRRLHGVLGSIERREFWRRDAGFVSVLDHLSKRTDMIVDPARCYTLYQLARSLNGKQGDIAEVGVYKGGTAGILATASPAKRVSLFDTFTGMPSSDPSIDFHGVGEFDDTCLEAVKRLLAEHKNVEFHVGMFPDTAGPVMDSRFSLVHLDVDNYQSNKDALAFFYDRMVIGGAIVFDDYQWEHTPGIKKSIDEFLVGKPDKVMLTAEYQCVIFKV